MPGIRSTAALLAGSLLTLASLTNVPLVDAQGDGCAPAPAGYDGVFILRVADGCVATDFPRAEDVSGVVANTGQAPDGYVLAADMVRDDGAKEALVLVQPWGFDRYVLGLTIARVLHDGSVDGQPWHAASASSTPVQ